MEAIPFLIPIAVFIVIGLVVKIAALRQLRHIKRERNGSRG